MKQTILGLLLSLGIAGHAFATEGFSYSYAELGWVKQDFDDLDVEGDGPGIRASFELTPALHLFGSFSDQDFDVGANDDVNGESLALGAGYAWSISPQIDIVGNAAYLREEIDVQLAGVGSGSFEDDGFGIAGYVRARPVERLELTGGLNYVDFDESGDDTLFTAGARFFVTRMFALGVDVTLNDDTTTYVLGGRINFGGK